MTVKKTAKTGFACKLICYHGCMDLENAAVKLCTQGLAAETQGNHEKALELYMQAWNNRADGFEGSIAAHYIAKHQKSPEDTFHWNNAALAEALTVDDDRVRAFFPSLYLNLGKSYEDLGQMESARQNYTLGLGTPSEQPDDGLGNMIRRGLENGLRRVKEKKS